MCCSVNGVGYVVVVVGEGVAVVMLDAVERVNKSFSRGDFRSY